MVGNKVITMSKVWLDSTWNFTKDHHRIILNKTDNLPFDPLTKDKKKSNDSQIFKEYKDSLWTDCIKKQTIKFISDKKFLFIQVWFFEKCLKSE